MSDCPRISSKTLLVMCQKTCHKINRLITDPLIQYLTYSDYLYHSPMNNASNDCQGHTLRIRSETGNVNWIGSNFRHIHVMVTGDSGKRHNTLFEYLIYLLFQSYI